MDAACRASSLRCARFCSTTFTVLRAALSIEALSAASSCALSASKTDASSRLWRGSHAARRIAAISASLSGLALKIVSRNCCRKRTRSRGLPSSLAYESVRRDAHAPRSMGAEAIASPAVAPAAAPAAPLGGGGSGTPGVGSAQLPSRGA